MKDGKPSTRHSIGSGPLPPVVVGRHRGASRGNTTVMVGGARYYYAGGIHYRAEFYQGRTCYVRVRL